MEDIERRLARLAKIGFNTPETRVMRVDRFFELLRQDQTYYARATFENAKVGIVGSPSALVEAAARLPEDTRWRVQQVIEFTISGAAIACNRNCAIEVVFGSPIALLRGGELAYRRIDSNSASERRYDQNYRFEMTESGLIKHDHVVGEPSNGFDPLVHKLSAKLRDLHVDGLFEWGLGRDGDISFLDYKNLTPIELSRIFMICQSGTSAQGSEPDSHAQFFDRPDLKHASPRVASSIAFETGARLSHFVSRNVHKADIWFLS